MDVEHRSGQLYNSELPSSYVALPTTNNSNMNQFLKQKSKLRKQLKSRIGSSSSNVPKSQNMTPTFEVLPKIEPSKYSSSVDQYHRGSGGHILSSTNNSSVTTDTDDTDLPISEAFTKNNVDEWLKMPSKKDQDSHVYQGPGSSIVSSQSGNMLTPVEVDYFTDCTSVTSSEWGDDVCEFDKNESYKVNQMFEEIEWMLFADNSSSTRSSSNRANRSSSFSGRNGIQSGPLHLRRECKEWTNQFPHFRLVGRQISVPQEQGFTFNESERSGSVTPKNSPRVLVSDSGPGPSEVVGQPRWVSTVTDIERLSLVGQGIRLRSADKELPEGFDELSVGSSQEEVFALDGDMVEIIAIDYKMDEDYTIHNQKKCRSKHTLFRNGKGYPPITPNAVIRDAVLTAIFDNMWSNVVDWVVPLLTKMYQSYSLRDMIVMENTEPSQTNNSLTPDIYRISKPFPHFPISFNNLDNILKISTKTLQFREKSYLQSIPEQSQNLTSSIKGTLGFSGGTKPSFTFLSQIRRPSKLGLVPDRSQTPLSVNESTFLHDKESKRTPPLNQSYFLSTMAPEGLSPLRCLRGKALYQSHSPELLARSGTLPPIHKYSALTNFRHPGSRIGSAQVQHSHMNQSTSSIVNPHSLTGPVLMTSADIAQTRPCTSHTARSDQAAGNRGSTPNGSRRSLNLNVHGSSITMNSLSMKTNEELSYDQLNKISRPRPYWKTYNNQIPNSNKRNKSLYNSVK